VAKGDKPLIDLAGTGDDGRTGLLGGGRAAKDDPRLEAYGTVDEASSALGLAKALSQDGRVKEICEELQRGLYKVGAELATNPSHKGEFAQMRAEDVERLDQLGRQLESEVRLPREFILPGTTPASAALDLARTVARRAERRALKLQPDHEQARRWLNRLSLVIFVLARYEEARTGVRAEIARQ
jgi:cob(I)alamin adenosyltransferase